MGRAWRPAIGSWCVDGVVQGYVLDSYSARKLGLKTTGNADGVHNLFIRSTKAAPSRAELLRALGTGACWSPS
jgi:PmbA protein